MSAVACETETVCSRFLAEQVAMVETAVLVTVAVIIVAQLCWWGWRYWQARPTQQQTKQPL